VIALFLVVSILVVILLLNVSGSIIVLMRSFQILSLLCLLVFCLRLCSVWRRLSGVWG